MEIVKCRSVLIWTLFTLGFGSLTLYKILHERTLRAEAGTSQSELQKNKN